MEKLEERFHTIRDKVPDEVSLIAVSKTQTIDSIEELYRLGQRDFGENYVQELVAKSEVLRLQGYSDIRWHFIGHLQSNKVRQLLPHVACIHSVDSVHLAAEISKRWIGSGVVPVFIQVNQDEEATKSGFLPKDVVQAVSEISAMRNLRILGLMSIPEPGADPRAKFKALRELSVACKGKTAGKLSMGMSSDYEQAIAEGATHVRIGTSIFGSRQTSSAP